MVEGLLYGVVRVCFVLPRIVKSGIMYSLTCALFSAKELQELVESSVACVCAEKRVRHISLLPHSLRDLKSAIHGTLFISKQVRC